MKNGKITVETKTAVTTSQKVAGAIMIIAGIAAATGFVAGIMLIPTEDQAEVTSVSPVEAWSTFKSSYGTDWLFTADTVGGGKRLQGGDIPASEITGTATVDALTIDTVSKAFLTENKAFLQVDTNNLTAHRTFIDDEVIEGRGESAIIHYNQKYKGLPVKDSKVTLAYYDNNLTLVDSHYADEDVLPLSTTPNVTQGQAETFAIDLESSGRYQSILGDVAQAYLEFTVEEKLERLDNPASIAIENLAITESTLLIYEFPENSETYVLAWEVLLERNDTASAPIYYFDALTGELLFREETILEETITGTISGQYYPNYPAAIRSGGDSPQTIQMPQENVLIAPSNLTDTSNNMGQYSISDIFGTQILESRLEGPYVQVVNDDESDLVHKATVNPPSSHSWDWSAEDTEVYGERSNVFYLVNEINQFFTSGSPFNIPIPMQVVAHVNSKCGSTEACNACANLLTKELKFLSEGTITYPDGSTLTCAPTSLGSDIIYHEFTHLINEETDTDMPGAMHEALADYWSSTLTSDECVGLGPWPFCIRHLSNSYQYPMFLIGKSHTDSQLLSGSLWDFRAIVGEEVADPLIMVAQKMAGRTFHSFLSNLIIADGGITGPHIVEICDSFSTYHGIYVPECAGKTTKPVANISDPFNEMFNNNNVTIPIEGTAYTAQGGTFTDFEIHYGEGYDIEDVFTWSSAGVTLTNGGTSPVSENSLGTIATDSLVNGWYVVRLTVNDSTGTIVHYSRFRYIGDMHMGWPIDSIPAIKGSAAFYDVDNDGATEVIYNDGNSVDARTHDGELLWSKININMSAPMNVVVGDLDLDGQFETIAVDYDDIYAWNSQGTQLWVYTTDNGTSTTPVIADVDPTSLGQEVIISSGHRSPQSMYILSSTGQLLHNWEVPNSWDPAWGGTFPSPAVGDIDGNPQNGLEIVATFRISGTTTTYVWDENGNQVTSAKVLSGIANASPVIADIDNNGVNDIIQSVYDSDPSNGISENRVYIWNKQIPGGLTGWPVTLPDEDNEPYASPSVADLDSNGTNEIVQSTLDGYVFIWNVDGSQYRSPLVGNVCGTMPSRSASTILVDMDNDSDLEILTGMHDGNLYAWHHTGAPVAGFPKSTMSWTSSTPTVGDIDDDGKLEIAMGTDEGYMYVWDVQTNFNASKQIWPTLHHDNTRSSNANYGICSDGTFRGMCSAVKPQLCQENLSLANNCSVCGCESGYTCGGDGNCQVCTCDGIDCGVNNCSQWCGSCDPGQICSGGQCVTCTPNCIGKICGSDGCGGSCGSCPRLYSCRYNGTRCISRCTSSFLAETPILMADGLNTSVDELEVGDKVVAFDVETGEFVKDEVTEVYEYEAESHVIINGYLKVTSTHPMYSQGEWVTVGELQVGDTMTNVQGEPVEIVSIQEVNKRATVYNIEVSPHATYIAGGMIVHNKPPGEFCLPPVR
ncbi:polymorphic toxin-type HINT domain-containing protein [Patescibacteria group bacterium]